MPQADHYKRRVTEIYCAGNMSYGSGFLLGNTGLVLTARHVLDPTGSGLAPAKIEARPVDLPGRKWLAAELVWPADPAELANQELDAALIRITPWGYANCFAATTRIGEPDDQDGNSITAAAIGFPKFTEKNEQRDTEEVGLEIRTGTGMLSGRYEILDRTFSLPGKNAELDWHGFSGAALLHQGQVIGVVITRKVGERHDFGAVRMQSLIAAPGFNEAAGKAAEGQQASETPPPPDLARLTCLLGRDPQEEGFEDLYAESVAEQPDRTHPRAMLCVVPGAHNSDHCPEDLADRFTLRSLPRQNWPRLDFTWLDWPSTTIITPGLRRLRSALWSKLCADSTKPAPDDPESYLTLLERGRPRLFRSDLTKREPTADLARLVAAWSKFWGELSCLSDRRPPIHLLLVNLSDQKRARDWLEQAPGSDGTVVAVLPDLDQCTGLELRVWFDDRLKEHVEERWRKRLDRALGPKYNTNKPFMMLPFRNDVKGIDIDG